MDALLILIGGGLVAVGLWTVLAARAGSRRVPARARARGARHRDPVSFGLRSARDISEDRDALEAEDFAQLLRATNARRRARGLPERTPEDARRELDG